MYRRHIWIIVCVLAIFSAMYWIGFDDARMVQAETQTTSVRPEGYSAVAGPIDDLKAQAPEKWLNYESEKGGYSFSYPATYTVTEYPSGNVVLRPLAADRTDGTIIFEYLAYELDDVTDDLVGWVDLYNHYHGEPVHPKASRADIAHLPKAGSQQVVIETPVTSPIYVHGFLFTNGKLVWRLYTNSTDETDRQLVNQIAETVQFTAYAPLTMQELYAPDEVLGISSVADMKEFYREDEMVQEAYRIRADTGETPTELLEQMSERARRYYEVTLENNASAIQAYDEQRASPPPVIEYTEEQYQSYLKSEEDYANGTLVPTLEEGARLESREFQQFLPGLFTEPSSNTTAFPSTHSVNTPSSPRSSGATQALCGGGSFPTWIIDRRRGMPTRFAPPIRVIGNVISCGSAAHVINTGRDGYAIDIYAGIDTNVYGVTQNEYVYEMKTDWIAGEGYGNYVRTKVSFDTGGVLREYHTIYAHLNTVNAIQWSYVGPSDVIAQSGKTGTSAEHLHFAVAIKEGNEFYPVDLSPMKGFTPNLDYPKNCATCGYVEDKDDGHRPIIIEANEFKNSYIGYTYPSHYWNCSQYFGDKHTGFCYRAAVPIDPVWGLDYIDTSNSSQSPRMDYELWIAEAGVYRIWVCGMGGSGDDDSLHMGFDDVPRQASDRMQGFHTSQWVWASQTMDGPYPLFYLSTGYHDINVWARENGLRIDRVLLTLDHNFDPTTGQIRCAGEGLYP